MSENYARRIVMNRACDIADDVPTWVWEYAGRGRIALGTVALGAGRPAAGKSTFARWFVAQVTAGTLAGHWEGKPNNVAYIAREESINYVVKPSLRAHAADLDRVFFPEVQIEFEDGVRQTPISTGDMDGLIAECRANTVKLVVVDPLMSMLGGKADVNRNNEVRAHLEPWRRLAEEIDGIVIGIAHLNKSGNGDVVAGINGSSAFGEIARSVFGFAKDPDAENGERVMSQEKNSLGDEDLALSYRIESTEIRTDSGRTAEVGRFVILGDSDRSVGDVLRDAARPESANRTDYDGIVNWLRDLVTGGPIESKEVFAAGDASGYSKDQIKRAKAKAGDIEAVRPVNPGPWFWQRAGSTSPNETTTRQEVLPAPCEVRGGLAGSREQGAGSTREPLPETAPPGGITSSTPGMSVRVQEILNRQEDQ